MDDSCAGVFVMIDLNALKRQGELVRQLREKNGPLGIYDDDMLDGLEELIDHIVETYSSGFSASSATADSEPNHQASPC